MQPYLQLPGEILQAKSSHLNRNSSIREFWKCSQCRFC